MKMNPEIPVFGNIDYRGDCHSETAEQATFVNQLRKRFPDSYGATVVHIRNEGKRNYAQTARYKAEGLTPGAADIIIPGNPTFVCEMKRLDHSKSRWQEGQQEYLLAAKRQGAFVCVALGAVGAIHAFEEWVRCTTAT